MILLHFGPHTGNNVLDSNQVLWLTGGVLAIASLAFVVSACRDEEQANGRGVATALTNRLDAAARATARLGLCVLMLATVVGLLNTPTTCTCGADIPHEHSIFTLAGHHHHHDDTAGLDHDRERTSHGEQYEGPNANGSGSSGPASQPIATTRQMELAQPAEIRELQPPDPLALIGSYVDSIDPPPPRT